MADFFAVGLVLLRGRMSTIATIVSPWVGLAFGLIAWFVTTSERSGIITVTTTGDVTNAVAGNVTSWGTGFLLAVILSLLFPKKFSTDNLEHLARTNNINGIGSSPQAGTRKATPTDPETESKDIPTSGEKGAEAPTSAPEPEALGATGNEVVDFLEAKQIEPVDPTSKYQGVLQQIEKSSSIFKSPPVYQRVLPCIEEPVCVSRRLLLHSSGRFSFVMFFEQDLEPDSRR